MVRSLIVGLVLVAMLLQALDVHASGKTPDDHEAGSRADTDNADVRATKLALRLAKEKREKLAALKAEQKRILEQRNQERNAYLNQGAAGGSWRPRDACADIHDRPRVVRFCPDNRPYEMDVENEQNHEIGEIALLLQQLQDMKAETAKMSKRKDQEYEALGRHMSELQIGRRLYQQNSRDMQHRLDVAAENDIEVRHSLALAENVNKLAEERAADERVLLRNNLRSALVPIERAIQALPGRMTSCDMCVSERYRAFVTGIDHIIPGVPALSREERSRRISEWENGPEGEGPLIVDWLMIQCTNKCHICIACCGVLLAKSKRARSTDIACPCYNCAGRVATSGARSLSDMAISDLERANLASHLAWVPRPLAAQVIVPGRSNVVADEGRVEVNAVWLLLASIMLAIGGLSTCPSCRRPISLPENCAKITCDGAGGCKAHFCGWCLGPNRSPHKLDGEIYGSTCSEFRVHAHARMCHVLLWAMYFTHFQWHQGQNNFRYLVTSEALRRNAHGDHSFEHGKSVIGMRPTPGANWHSHYLDALPDNLLARDRHDDFLSPNFSHPVSLDDKPFAIMWGSGIFGSDTYYNRLPFRRKDYFRQQLAPWHRVADANGRRQVVVDDVMVSNGWSHDSLRVMSSSVLHFKKFCEMVEDWVSKYMLLYNIAEEALSIDDRRIQEVFDMARRFRHRFECNVPWQALMAMRAHQLREGYEYQDPVVVDVHGEPMLGVDGQPMRDYANNRAATAADASYEPFPPSWRLDTSFMTYRATLTDYFDTNFRLVDGVGEAGLFRQPWEGFPFIVPGDTSANDIVQAGVIYRQVLSEFNSSRYSTLLGWEFSLAFHTRYLALWKIYVDDPANVAGDMPPDLIWERGDTD